MPARTNEFQELVALVQQALAPEGAVVTESALVDAPTEGKSREIDVLIETNVGDYRLRIAVEAKDESRPMDSTRFESIVGKYLVEGGVKVNKIVVVTHRGFYKPVIKRAKMLDIDLLTLKEAKHIDWSQFRPPGPCFTSAVQIRNIGFAPPSDDKEDVLRRGRVVCSCGRHYGSLGQFARYVFWQVAVKEHRDRFMEFDEQAASKQQEKKANVKIAFTDAHKHYLLLGHERQLLEAIWFDVHFGKPVERDELNLAKIQLSLAPHICSVEVVPPIEGVDAAELRREARVVCSCCGKDHGSIIEWAHVLTMTRFFPSNPQARKLFADGLRDSPTGHVHLEMTWPFCKRLRVRLKGQDYAVREVRVRVHAAAGTAPLECKQYDMEFADGRRARRVSHMEATVAGKKLRFLILDGVQSRRSVLRIDDATTEQER